jgi:RHS repeat-associated protein
VRQIVASDGTVRDAITYDSFGQVVRETNPSAGDRFKYTGREWHAALDQYYYRARYYDPGVGRFLGEAPLRFRAGDSNLYRYVFNSPTNYTDPSGKALPLILIIGGAAVIGILAVPNVANAPGPGEPHFGRPDPFLQQGVVGWKAMRKICLLLAGAGALLGMVGEGDVPNGGQDIGPVDPPDRFIVDRDLAQAYRALEEALRDLRNTNPWEHPEEWAEIMEKVQRLRQQIDDWPR